VKIALIGYGKMGEMIERIAEQHQVEIVERFWDIHPFKDEKSTRSKLEDVSVLIDFSIPEAVLDNIRNSAALSKNIVIGTTGWHEHLREAQEIVEKNDIGLVYASNFSLGVNLFYQIVEFSSNIMSTFKKYDPFIEESHHKFKKDAPSGTGLVLKNILESKYNKNSIPITSVRAGYIPGQHTVSFDSQIDTINLKHTARNREGFAEGSIIAAKWIVNRKGFFEFKDVLKSMLEKK
jgi:4-hydroxy-tetrahydrodipicolinate reductase